MNEMQYSGGLVSERNLCDCGAETKDEGQEKERREGGADRELGSSSGASALL